MTPNAKSVGALLPPRSAMPVLRQPGLPRIQTEPAAGLGQYIVAAFLFLCIFIVQSRSVEQLGLPGVASTLLVLGVIWAALGGSVRLVLTHRVTITLIGLFLWECLSALFGVWRGGSIGVLTNDGIRSLGWFFVVLSLVNYWKVFSTAVAAVALSGLYAALWALTAGQYHEGRLEVGGGTFADPNALALFLTVSLPMWWLLMRLSPSYLMKAVYLICTVPILIVFAKTGSRGGFVAIVIMLAVHFVKGTSSMRWRIMICTALVTMMAPFFLTSYLMERFVTFFSVSNDSENAINLAGNDVASSMSRKELLMQSLEITARNPVFGVGPGNFADVVYREFKAGGGLQFINHATHNTYTQYSCEAGIPAMLLFIYSLGIGLRGKWRTGRERLGYVLPGKYEASLHYMRLSLVVIAVFAMSLSFAYKPIVYLFLALMIGLLQLCQNVARESAQQGPKTV